ncbi:hypothetical protein LTS18_005185, partial [Coniosporium uncinatum]
THSLPLSPPHRLGRIPQPPSSSSSSSLHINTTIQNRAMGGRSSRSYTVERRFSAVCGAGHARRRSSSSNSATMTAGHAGR